MINLSKECPKKEIKVGETVKFIPDATSPDVYILKLQFIIFGFARIKWGLENGKKRCKLFNLSSDDDRLNVGGYSITLCGKQGARGKNFVGVCLTYKTH